MNLILQLFLTFSSVSYFIVVYLVQHGIYYPKFPNSENYEWIICLFYLIIPVILTFISLNVCKVLSLDSINRIKSIETSNNDFLANYLAFFFVALGVNKELYTFWVVFGLTVIFTFFSRVSFFNPMFLLFGYHFYYVHTMEDAKVMLISRKKIKNPQSFPAMQVRRINDYTFIEV